MIPDAFIGPISSIFRLLQTLIIHKCEFPKSFLRYGGSFHAVNLFATRRPPGFRRHFVCARRSWAHSRNFSWILEQELGIDASIVPSDVEEQVRSGGAARCANQAYRVALLDLLTSLHLDLGEVEIHALPE
jgi:hypothetical protein